MLAPAWAQLKLGPIVRGEIDYRLYHNLFRHHPAYVSGLKRTLVRVVASEVKEPPALGSPVGGAGTIIVRFEGQAAAFAPLTGWREHLYRELHAITRNRWLDAVDRFPQVPIGVHVRCGDFVPPVSVKDLQTKGNIRTPLAWFVDCLEAIRKAVDAPVRAYVVSDGRPSELKELLATPNVVLARTGSAISDLLLLARARVLVASGSSFSAWASF
jgi:Glycosyl transferase family 11